MKPCKARLAYLWNAGMTASEVARELRVTKNTVIGAVRRLRENDMISRPMTYDNAERGRLGMRVRWGWKRRGRR